MDRSRPFMEHSVMFKTMDMLFIIFIIFYAPQRCYSLSWNFSIFNVSDNMTIWRFAVWRNRAFFAVPRWGNDSNRHPTLLEAPWYPDLISELSPVQPSPNVSAYPSVEIQSTIRRCNNLISIVGLDTDNRGRLWVLDSPENTRCSAKIILFDLRRNEEICRDFFSKISKKGLRSLVVDPVVGIWGYRAYIGDPGDSSILIYHLGHNGLRKWWKLKLLHSSILPGIFSTDLAICRRNHLFITGGNSLHLFSINVDNLRNEDPNSPTKITNTTYHGIKMGVSSGLLCDLKGGLHYFLVTEHASVRWDTKHDLKATYHAILLQSEQALSITDYTMDIQRNVWGLVNHRHPFLGGDKYRKGKEKLSNRIVRVLKYNLFAP